MTIEKIFNPKSVAIVGASGNTKKWGGAILQHLKDSGYKGEIYPINKKELEVQGLKSYASVLDVPNNIDSTIIVIPANVFNSILDECGKKGVKSIIGITAGFKEIGNFEEENKTVEICKKYGMRMIGPNTLGIIGQNFNASIINTPSKIGNISFIAQSGTMCLALVEYAIQKGLGLNKVISLGNQSDIDIVDLLEYLDSDESTKVIVCYIEGIERGKKFIEVAKKIKKPIIVLKAGRSTKGAKAAFSHTGSMAGSDEIYDIAFKQSGCLRIDDIDEIFEISSIFSMIERLPKNNNVAIITNGGGAGILATDACEKFNIDIPDISQETKNEIRKYIPQFATASNPTDTAAGSTYEIYYGAIKSMLKDDNIDSLICIYVHSPIQDSMLPAQALIDCAKETDKNIIACWFGQNLQNTIKMLEENNIPTYIRPENAVKALNYLIQQKIYLERKNEFE